MFGESWRRWALPKDDQDFLKLEDQDLKRMYLPAEFWESKLSDFAKDTMVHNALGKKYPVAKFFKATLANMATLRRKGYGPLICGDSGVGKTALAAMILKEARRRKYTTFFAMVWDLRDSISHRLMFDVNHTIMERCRDVDFLVLDGLEGDQGFQRILPISEIERLVVWRGQQGKVTIVTTRAKTRKDFTDQKLEGFVKGTGSYLTQVLLLGEGVKSVRRASMIESLFEEGS